MGIWGTRGTPAPLKENTDLRRKRDNAVAVITRASLQRRFPPILRHSGKQHAQMNPTTKPRMQRCAKCGRASITAKMCLEKRVTMAESGVFTPLRSLSIHNLKMLMIYRIFKNRISKSTRVHQSFFQKFNSKTIHGDQKKLVSQN